MMQVINLGSFYMQSALQSIEDPQERAQVEEFLYMVDIMRKYFRISSERVTMDMPLELLTVELPQRFNQPASPDDSLMGMLTALDQLRFVDDGSGQIACDFGDGQLMPLISLDRNGGSSW